MCLFCFFFFKQKTAYEMRISDWSSDVCSSDLWAGLQVASGDDRRGSTAVEFDLLKEVGYSISEVPANVHVNPKIIRQLKAKRKMIDTGEGIDWATAESLAFGDRKSTRLKSSH